MIKSLLIFLVFISLAATCQKTNKDISQEENPCDADIMCTMDFRVITVTVEDKAGNPVVLDDFYTDYEGFTFRTQRDEYQINEGSYPVANDGDMDKLSFKGQSAQFVGIKNGEKIVQHTLKVGKDCCHVLLMEGEKKVVVRSR